MRMAAPPETGADDRWALFQDVDGTLLDFAHHPDSVEVDTNLHDDLGRLRWRLDGAMALLSCMARNCACRAAACRRRPAIPPPSRRQGRAPPNSWQRRAGYCWKTSDLRWRCITDAPPPRARPPSTSRKPFCKMSPTATCCSTAIT